MWTLGVVFVVWLAACDSGEAAKTPPELCLEEDLALFKGLNDKMCACKDPACGQRIFEEMTTWSQEQAKHVHEPPQISERDRKRFAEVGEEMGKCLQNAMSADLTPRP